MRALQRKLVRDLVRLRGQLLSIALVLASGLASFVALRGNYASLTSTRDAFYEQQRFADVFVALERAPAAMLAQLESLPGVARGDARVEGPATILLDPASDPIRARIVSLPEPERETLDAIHLRQGRRPVPDRNDEVVLLDGFATARRLGPGTTVDVVVEGKRRTFAVVGTAVSPEYVMAISPGSLSADPDDFAVIWANPAAAEAAFAMEGAFNHVAFALQPGTDPAAVIETLDRVLEPHGGLGAQPRARQPSEYMLAGELQQLRGMSNVLPAIFLLVAVLLVHVVLSRLVTLQQPEIATLKAIGYSDARIGLHVLSVALAMAAIGTAIGVGAGAWLGTAMTGLYAAYFRFPELAFVLDVRELALAGAMGVGAVGSGALGAVIRVASMPPAEAMRPPAPTRYRRSLLDRLGLSRSAGPVIQMVVRELERRPLRTLMSVLAISASTGLTVVGAWYYDGVRALIDLQFHVIMREDAAVMLAIPASQRVVSSLAALDGVIAAEGLRSVPVRFVAGSHRREGTLIGHADHAEMRLLRDTHGRPIPTPAGGVVLTDFLAEILGVAVGDTIAIEAREGDRARRMATVTGLVDEPFGLQGHMPASELAAWAEQTPSVSSVLLRIDPQRREQVDARLRRLPAVAQITRRSEILREFEDQSGSTITITALLVTALAATITIGTVYNNARVALSMRARDLASLRVLGFSRAEISGVLLGELGLQVLLAVPLGLTFGHLLVLALASTVDPETYRLPVLFTPRTYAFAAGATLAASLASALLVRRRLDRLDLVAVLKSRE